MFILGCGSVETDFYITAIEVDGRSMELGNRQGAVSRYLPPILSGQMWASTVAVVESEEGPYPPKINQFSATGKEYDLESLGHVRASEAGSFSCKDCCPTKTGSRNQISYRSIRRRDQGLRSKYVQLGKILSSETHPK